jgi:hypothetical protein
MGGTFKLTERMRCIQNVIGRAGWKIPLIINGRIILNCIILETETLCYKPEGRGFDSR